MDNDMNKAMDAKRLTKFPMAIAVASAALMGAGCSTQTQQYSEKNALSASDRADSILKKNRSNSSLVDTDLISVNTGLYLSAEAIAASSDSDLPDAFNKSFLMYTHSKTNIFEIMAKVTDMTGIQVDFTPDAFSYITKLGDTPVDRSSKRGEDTTESTPNEGGTPTVMAGSEQFANILESYMDDEAGQEVGDDMAKKMLLERLVRKVSYEGSLDDFMDSMLSSTGLSWDYADNRVTIRRYVTKTFLIDAIPGTSQIASKVSSDGGKEGKKSSDSTSNKAEIDLWADLEEAIDSMLTEGGNYSISEGSGTLMVTDTPQVVGKIDKYVQNINAIVTKRFAINTEIIEVELSDSDSLGIDWNLAYKNMLSRSPINPTDLVDFSLDFNPTDGMTAAIVNPGSPWTNTQTLIQALQEQGRVSVKTSQTVITSNGQVAPVQVLNETTYLAEISVETNDDGSNSYSMTPDTVISGMTLNILPKQLSNGNIMLHYNLDITTLQNMAEYGAGDNKIQLPETKTQNFLQRVPVKPGSKMMLTGFEQVTDNFSYEGQAKRSLWGLGGRQKGQTSRVVTLIIVTPQIIE